jgi:hypothetical protein
MRAPHHPRHSCFLRLPAPERASLLDTLTSNLESLAASASDLLEEWDSATSAAIAAHKNAIKMHVFLLHCAWGQAQEEAERLLGQPSAGSAGAGTGAGAAASAGRGRGSGAAGEWTCLCTEKLL